MSKYHNVRTTVNGIPFDSKKEAERYLELLWFQQAGHIRNLKLQPEFTLIEAYVTPDGDKVNRMVYRADFSFERKTEPDSSGQIYWVPCVEDVKGVKTEAYKLKKKLMLSKYGIRVEEI